MPLSRPLPAHKRNKLVTIQRLRRGIATDAGGHVNAGDPSNYENFLQVWCSVIPRGAREFFRREQVASDITHQVEMLYSPETAQVTNRMILVFEGRTLAIAEYPQNVDENNHSLVFACKEIK